MGIIMKITKSLCVKSRAWWPAAVLATGLLASNAAVSAPVWVNVDTTQFTTLGLNTPTAVNFLGTGDVTMTRTSTVGGRIATNTWAGTFNASVNSNSNPDWVQDARTYFQLGVSGAETTPPSTVSYELAFSSGLATSTKLVFIDFDSLERVTIKAYDASNALIPFANTAILFAPGQDNTPVYSGISWAASGGATGLLANTDNDSESNIIATISSTTSIYRLVYEFDFTQVDSGGGTVRFQLAADASTPVPVPSSLALLSLTLGGLAFGQWRRSRRSSPMRTHAVRAPSLG